MRPLHEQPTTINACTRRYDGEPFVANVAGFALRVDDVAAARAELEAKGVEFVAETWDSGACHFAALRDPDGNTVILHRRYAPRTPRVR